MYSSSMRFVAANATIPVPRIYQSRPIEDESGRFQSIMEYMPGKPLDKESKTLTHDQRILVCRQLVGYLSQLKRLKGKRIQSANGGLVTVGLRFPRQGGPFNTEKEFNDFMVDKDNEFWARYGIFRQYKRAALSDDHKIHFAHGDISPRNILIDDNFQITTILDWDRAEWNPEYWDQNRIVAENPGIRDYTQYLVDIVNPPQYAREITAIGFLHDVSRDAICKQMPPATFQVASNLATRMYF